MSIPGPGVACAPTTDTPRVTSSTRLSTSPVRRDQRWIIAAPPGASVLGRRDRLARAVIGTADDADGVDACADQVLGSRTALTTCSIAAVTSAGWSGASRASPCGVLDAA